MYQAQPTITDNLSQQQVLQLMLLADRFEVPKVLAAAAAALVAVPPDQLGWDTALQLLQLPQSCVLQPDFKAAHQLALHCMMQQLGDLESVWASDALQQQLLALPYDVLRQLLAHHDTRVASENTVVFTIERWQRGQGARQPHRLCRRDQVQHLMQLVRMRYCTPCYAGTVMPHSSTVQQGIERSAIPLMRECCTQGGFEMLTSAKCSVLQQYAHWSAVPRPKSEQQPVLEWQLLLDDLKTAAEQLFSSSSSSAGSGSTVVGFSATSIVQGQPMQTKAQLSNKYNKEGTDTPALHLGLFLRLLELPAGAVRKVQARFSIMPARLVWGMAATSSHWFETAISAQKDDWGTHKMLCLGNERSWQAIEAELKRLDLVHGGGSAGSASQGQAQRGHLHVKVHVEELN
jgi:hypothetical protein